MDFSYIRIEFILDFLIIQKRSNTNMERYVVGFSANQDKETAFEENCIQILKKAGTKQPVAIIFFSDHDNFEWYSTEFKKRFPDSDIIGATTYIGFSSLGFGYNSLTSLSLISDIECSSGILKDINLHPIKYVHNIKNAVKSVSSTENCCCMEFSTARGKCEELILDTFETVLKPLGIPLIGGNAGAANAEQHTLVSLNGKVYKNACVFLILRNLRGRIFLYKENIYRPTKNFFTVTDVNLDEHIVYELDKKPIAGTIAKTLNIKTEELPDYVLYHPLGRIKDGQIYITDYNKIFDDESISFYVRIYNYTRLCLMELTDYETVRKQTLSAIKNVIEKPAFTIAINCFNRSKLFEKNKTFDAFVQNLKSDYGDFIGLSGFGEQINFTQLNQTLVFAVFE